MSDDDLGGYGTPPIPQTKSRASRSQGNRAAGPSSKPGSRVKPKPTEPLAEVIAIDDDLVEDELGSTSLPAHRRNPTGHNPAKIKPNSVKGKGKAKAQPQNYGPSSRLTGDDDLQVEESDNEMGTQVNAATSRLKTSGVEVVERKQYDELERRFKREKNGREEMEQRCEDLAKQLEKIMRVRETEAEALMLAQKQQFQAEILALERVNKELTTNLAKVEPLMRSSKTSVLHLLTREAADEENRKFENEVLVWRQQFEEAQDTIKERDQTIKEKDQLLKESAQQKKELLYELEVENKNFLALKTKTQQGSVRPQGDVLGPDQPQNLQLVRLYEDSTNLLIMGLKPQRSQYLNLDDWTATCVFTYMSSNDASRHSLNFTLICRWERLNPEDDTTVKNKGELHEMMYYEPLELDKEPEEFIERLQHMGTAFSFTRDQLALFMRTLYNTLDEALHAEEGEDAEVSEVEMIE
ncbi:hypothetical protein J3R30DRAFT_3695297 [Lentinula aciculospora]|uniref:Monopolin complex subunit Csm1/Pcs1 C-terminal domain-containing protein n=1 Tax=Lentinula aciculospora TaxID=153920 RepID=A0A9W9APM6_9AGAR|nr:hypothetical protein J3R30DRAFT_3695297 [Lentinula aciculospora]